MVKVKKGSLEAVKDLLPEFYNVGFDLVEDFYSMMKNGEAIPKEERNAVLEGFISDIEVISESSIFKKMEELFTTYAPVGKSAEFDRLNSAYTAFIDKWQEMNGIRREIGNYLGEVVDEGKVKESVKVARFVRDTYTRVVTVGDFLVMTKPIIERFKPQNLIIEEKDYGTPPNNILTKDNDMFRRLAEVFQEEYKPEYMDEDEFEDEVAYVVEKYVDYGLEEIGHMLKDDIERWERNNADRRDEYYDRFSANDERREENEEE